MCPWNKILALPNCCKNWVLQKESQRKRTLKHKQALAVSQVQPQYHKYIHTPLPLLRKRETEREKEREMYAWFWKTAFLYLLHWRNSSRTVHPNKNIIPVILPARSARSSCYLLFLWQYCSQNLDLLENYLSPLTVVWTLPHSWICFLCPFSPVTSPSLLSCIDRFRKGIFGLEESPVTQWNKTAYSWMLILQIGKSGFLYILSKPFTCISNNLIFKMLYFGYITDYKWSVHCPSF